MTPNESQRERMIAASSARFDDFIDELTGTSREQRRAALNERIDGAAMRLGRERMKPKVLTPTTPQELSP